MRAKGIEELRLEWLKLEKLIGDFEFYENVLIAVIRRESADIAASEGAVPDSGYGMMSQQAYEGYSLLIKAFMAINSDSLSPHEYEKLKSALELLETLRQQCIDLYLLEAASFPTYIANRKAAILAQLEATGVAYTQGGYLRGGTNAHHAILRYTKDGDVYTRTEFNEGSGVEYLSPPGDTKYGWGVNKRVISRDNLENVIGIDVSNLFSNEPATKQVAPLFEPRSKQDIEQSIITTLQTVGNCNTRSTRSLLRLILGPEILRSLYEVVVTPLPEIQTQLAGRFDSVEDEILRRRKLESLIASRHEVQTAPTLNSITPIVLTKDMDVKREQFSKLCDSVIIQAEHILQGTFAKNDQLKLFKESLLKDLLTNNLGDTRSWPYLEAKSIQIIGFIMAKNLIDNRVFQASNLNRQNSITISPITDVLLTKVTLEGIRKSNATRTGAEDDLGIDTAISERAFSLIKTLGTKGSINYSGDLGAKVVQAQLIAKTKELLFELSKPYRIDDNMLKIIENQLSTIMAATLNVPFTINQLSANTKQIIDNARKSLSYDNQLKTLEKATLLQPKAKTVGKLKIDRRVGISDALAQQELARINKILDGEAPITSEFLTNAMKFAIEYDFKTLSDRLLKTGLFHKVGINTEDRFGQTLLMNAAQKGDIASMNTLLAAGADPLLKNKAGNTALMQAIESGHTEIVLKAMANSIPASLQNQLDAKDNNGNTLLQRFILQGNLEIVRAIIVGASALQQGLLDAKDEDGHTLLQFTINQGNIDLIKAIIESAPALQQNLLAARDDEGNTPLHQAAGLFGRTEILNAILDSAPALQQSMLHAKDFDGRAPLHLAASKGKTELVKALLARDQNLAESQLRTKDKDGRTPLHLAVFNGKRDVVQAILDHIKDNPVKYKSLLEEKDNSGRTPLELATADNRAEGGAYDRKAIALLLLKSGANPSLVMVMNIQKTDPEYNRTLLRNYLSATANSAISTVKGIVWSSPSALYQTSDHDSSKSSPTTNEHLTVENAAQSQATPAVHVSLGKHTENVLAKEHSAVGTTQKPHTSHTAGLAPKKEPKSTSTHEPMTIHTAALLSDKEGTHPSH